jgi:hypothetical protein
MLHSQAGQGLVEYILVLVVTVAIILGGVYQFNTAFQVWAHSYFGDYLACLLETGELPSMGGPPSKASICGALFKEFSLKDGRPLLAKGSGGKGGNGSGGNGGRGRGGSAGSGSSRIGGRFSGGGYANNSGSGGGRGKSDSNYTGNTGVSSVGRGYGGDSYLHSDDGKERLDNQFAFDNERDNKQKRRSVANDSAKSQVSDTKDARQRARALARNHNGDDKEQNDSQMTFGNFIRFLIIAAIVIALVMLIGGQMLQVGKSME